MGVAPLRWGILSTARITEKVLAGAAECEEAEFVAVASRERARAEAFARAHGLERAYGSYEELLADPAIDAVYVPLPNALHREWSIRALEAGKHVLCEKPLSSRPDEVERIFNAAQSTGRLVMEAFMYRHHPQTRRLVELVAEGTIGPPRLVRAAFSFPLAAADDIRLSPALDGGALMDVGCYCVNAARMLLGEPERVFAEQAVLHPGSVDVVLAATLRFGDGAVAHFDCGLALATRSELEVVGERGTALSGDPWHCVKPAIFLAREGEHEERALAVERVNPYACQLAGFAGAAAGAVPPLLGRADAVGQARTIAALLRSARDGEAVTP